MSNQDLPDQQNGQQLSYLDPQRRATERRNLLEFMQSLQNNREAYELFYEHAEKRGILQSSPKRKFQN